MPCSSSPQLRRTLQDRGNSGIGTRPSQQVDQRGADPASNVRLPFGFKGPKVAGGRPGEIFGMVLAGRREVGRVLGSHEPAPGLGKGGLSGRHRRGGFGPCPLRLDRPCDDTVDGVALFRGEACHGRASAATVTPSSRDSQPRRWSSVSSGYAVTRSGHAFRGIFCLCFQARTAPGFRPMARATAAAPPRASMMSEAVSTSRNRYRK